MCLVFCLSFLRAQDIHFSQFFAAPLLINPANTGNFNGIGRVGLNYRDQWGSVTIPYKTYALYSDYAIQPKRADNRLGLGVAAFNDQAGDGDLTTSKAYFSAAYHIGYTKSALWRLAIGMSGGIVQKKVDISKLVFDNQWDQFSFNTGLPSNEYPASETIHYLDFAAGGLLTYLPYEGHQYFLGVSELHINRPDESFFENNNTVGMRTNVVLGGFFPAGLTASMEPELYVSTQKKALEIIMGSNFSFPLQAYGGDVSRALFTGVWYRYNDAVWAVLGITIANFTSSLSYDLNISSLAPASHTLGGFEFSVAYTFSKEPKNPLKCPAYQ